MVGGMLVQATSFMFGVIWVQAGSSMVVRIKVQAQLGVIWVQALFSIFSRTWAQAVVVSPPINPGKVTCEWRRLTGFTVADETSAGEDSNF